MRSNRALDEFAHAISHDLKAPLRSVANYARWIEEDLADVLTGETRAHMDLLRSQVDRMRAMINGVLEYARSGRTRLEPELVDTSALVAEVIALLDPPPSVTVEVAPDMPTFTAEAAPLRQVLLNLIDNAVKHAKREDVQVRVSATDVGDAFHFAVRDNGPGIPPLAQEKIWLLFHRLEPRQSAGTAGDMEGTGIGLAIVRQLVELQGGRAWVESDVGKGSTFHFLWPKHQAGSQGGDRAGGPERR
jgi:signal transduction histidine kinase